jgi:hypothetical protein
MNAFSLLLSIAYLITVACCVVDILKTRRGSLSSAVWLFVVVIIPLGILAYIFFAGSPNDKAQNPPDVWHADAELKRKANEGTLDL